MNLHKRIAPHLPDLKNVISDKECLAINRKDYAIGEAGPLMAFLQAVRTGFNPEGLADYELFSLALALSHTNLFSARTRIVSLSNGTDAIAGALHYSLWLRRGRSLMYLHLSETRVVWEPTGPSSAAWLATMVKRGPTTPMKSPLWIFADYSKASEQAQLERLLRTGGVGFAKHGSHADAQVNNPIKNSRYCYAFSAIGYALVTPTTVVNK